MKLCLVCGERFLQDDWKCPSCGYAPEKRTGYWIFSPQMIGSNDGFDPDYFSRLAAIEQRNWWFRSRNKLIIWALGRFFPQAKNFYEIGCGTGFTLLGIKQSLPTLLLSGSDLFVEGLAYAENRLPGVTLFQSDARKIPFEEEFDVISAFDVLEHIQEDEEALFQMFRASKRGGGIMVTSPQHPFLWSKVDEYSFHKRRYTRKELVRKVTQAGFQDIWCTSFVSFLLPLMFLVRLGKGKNFTKFAVLDDLNSGTLINHILSKIMDMENFLIREGISLPQGGSLLMVAKRG
jgi:ubiquinone/menaquinone biosynthesis C-methylase UbiE